MNIELQRVVGCRMQHVALWVGRGTASVSRMTDRCYGSWIRRISQVVGIVLAVTQRAMCVLILLLVH